MKRALIKIYTKTGASPIIEINGRRLTSPFERAVFYASTGLLGLGIVLIMVYIVLLLIGIVVGLIFALIGVGIIVIGLILAVAVITGILEWLFGDGRRGNRWGDR
jgi:hypothetical protein